MWRQTNKRKYICAKIENPTVSRPLLDPAKSLANSDFKANLGKIIHDIYQTGHIMFGDMPQGDHKKRAKYRFASKTIMRILPASLKTEIEAKIAEKVITLDLYEILGQCIKVQK